MNKKLLITKTIIRIKSIRNKVLIWFNQIARGIKEILSYAHTRIKEWQNIETRNKYTQLELKL